MKHCPKCSVDLSPKSLGSVEVDECHLCKGIWFDHDELRTAKDGQDADLRWLDFEIWKHQARFSSQASPLNCPVCEKPMVTLSYGDTAVIIDHCPACKGTWLDKDEFKKIIDSLETEINTLPLSSYIKESIAEGKELFTGHESFLSEWKDFTAVLHLMQCRLYVENPNLMKTLSSLGEANPFK